MNNYLRATGIAVAALAFALVGCSKDEDKKGGETPATETPTAATETPGESFDPATLAEQVGVAPGGFEVPDDVGAEAVVIATGDGSVRRVGEEEWTAMSGETRLFAGDQVKTGAGASAVVTFADQSVAELAEETVVAIGDRNASADPASSAAVLYGVARFSVADRGPGEGPFLVYTPGGIVGTKGTTFGVGVAVTGEARVGVEEGEVEVVGHSDLETPVAVTSEKVISVRADGATGEPAEFKNDDWGEWRDGAEAEADPVVLVNDHRARLEVIEPEIDATYDALAELEAEVSAAESEAADFEKAKNRAGYAEVAPTWGVAVEASYLATLRLQHLTFAALAHAHLASAIHARHPDKVEKVYLPARPRIHAAILYNKKFEGAVAVKVKPMRGFYFRHHPRGRKHAAAMKVKVPAFYAGKLKPLEPAKVRAHAKVRVYRPPVIARFNAKKKVWVEAPKPAWHAEVKGKVHVRNHRNKTGWYVRPKTRRASVLAGVKVVKPYKPVFRAGPKVKRNAVKVRWGVRAGGGVGVKVGPKGTPGAGVKVGPRGGVTVKGKGGAGVKVGPQGGVMVKGKKGGKVGVGPKGGVTVKGKAGAGVKVGPKGGVMVKGKQGGKVGVKVGAKGGAAVGVKKPAVKKPAVKKPTVKGGVKVKAGVKGGVKVKKKKR